MAFRVAETLLAGEEAKGVGGEKERMLMVRGWEALPEGNSYLHLYTTVFSSLFWLVQIICLHHILYIRHIEPVHV